MPTMIQARESTQNIPTSPARLVRDVQGRFSYVDPDAAPFVLVSSKSRMRKAHNPRIEWIEKGLAPRWDAVNNGAGYNATATSIVVDNGAYFYAGDIVSVVRTGEKIRVTSVSTNTLTVVRAVDGDGTTGSAINDNDDLLILGQAYAENGALGQERSHQETTVHNFTQIFRLPFGASETLENSEAYGGKTRPRLRAENMVYHKIDIERAFLFGERNNFTTGPGSTDKPVRMLGGLLYFLDENNKDAGGTLTESELEDFAQKVFNATGGSSQRLLLASPGVCSILDQLAASRLQVVPKERTFGVAINQIVSNHGTLLVAKDRLLENGAVSAQGFGGYAIAVDMDKVAYRPLGNRTTKLRIDVGTPGDDGWTDEYISEVSLQVENPEVHGVLTNATA